MEDARGREVWEVSCNCVAHTVNFAPHFPLIDVHIF